MFKIQCDGLNTNIFERETLTSGSVNYHIVLFTFNGDWDGLIKKAMFKISGCDAYSVPIDDRGRAIIPRSLLRHENEGAILCCGVRGSNADDELILASTWASMGVIKPGAHLVVEPPVDPPSPDWYTNILDEIEKSRDHELLIHRDSEAQHPIESISGFDDIPNYEILQIWKEGLMDG